VPDGERLDVQQLARDLGAKAVAAPSTEAILDGLLTGLREGDSVVLLSNGAFDELPSRLLEALSRGARGSARLDSSDPSTEKHTA
jgi:UDP-N-acetylmuramate: L-alanyl-gamma-D-glutamyl-meso-diaminopimelate ligase